MKLKYFAFSLSLFQWKIVQITGLYKIHTFLFKLINIISKRIFNTLLSICLTSKFDFYKTKLAKLRLKLEKKVVSNG